MEAPVPEKRIVVLDFGGQYAHLIARRVRQAGVFSEILPHDTPAQKLSGVAGIILSGGPQSVSDEGSLRGDPALFDLGVPVLGICYGLQWMTVALGGNVSRGKSGEYGQAAVEILDRSVPLFRDCGERLRVWMSHSDEAVILPSGFTSVATSDTCTHAAIADPSRHLYAVQFHPEVTHTECGDAILQQFVALCDAESWSIEAYAEHIGSQVRRNVGDCSVFMLVSGGVDSTVAFALLNQVLGTDRVRGLFVDTGLMRAGERKEVTEAFTALGIDTLQVEDASDEFFANLEGVYEPEEKRRVIGDTFLTVQERISTKLGLTPEAGWMLGQGTIYPDTIETGGSRHSDQIKTHHNRVEAIQRMIEQGLVVEPLKELYKDEVRMLGEELGLPHHLVWRHPFPGPGLGVRILCAKEKPPLPEALPELPVASAILPVRSVGVQGDERSYRLAIALFSADRMPGDAAWELATSLPNSSTDINRVVQCTSHTQPPSFVFTSGDITPARAELLRQADAVVDAQLRAAGLYESIWQFPVILLPFGTTEGGQSVVLRPVESREAMTANAAQLPVEVVRAMTDRILAIEGIDAVFYDLTHKPPGTIEWE